MKNTLKNFFGRWFPTAESYPGSRLYSLDLLRGLDIFFLTCACGLFGTAHEGLGLFSEGFMEQFMHRWGLFHLIDIVMPMFIFMCGCAVPLALKRRLTPEGKTTPAFWKHVASRFALLWVFGMIAQGHLLSLDWREIAPFNNTLQTIACGYVIAALAMLIPSRKAQIALPILLALVYTVPLHLFGVAGVADYSRDGNAAWQLEVWILNHILPAGSNVIAHRDPGYTWFATIPMFGFMTLLGAESTRILLDKARAPMARFTRLFALGAVVLGLGWATYPWIPSIKHLYTFTFTAQAMGWCMISLAVCYVVSDVWRFRTGLGLFVLYGQFALTAYMFADTCFAAVPAAAASTACAGFPLVFGAGCAKFLTYVVQCVVLTGILCFRWRLRTAETELKKLTQK